MIHVIVGGVIVAIIIVASKTKAVSYTHLTLPTKA